jgi:tetratricopeptide (TPR) repeat protein
MFFGLHHYHWGEYAPARASFLRAETYGDYLSDVDLSAMARIYLGRCAKKLGGEPLDAIVKFKEAQNVLTEQHQSSALVTVIEVLAAAEEFYQGNFAAMHAKLDEAGAYLKSLNDYSTLGHIERLRGRILMREGKYANAVDHFIKSIETYGYRDPNHRGAARSYTNLARAKMLLAKHAEPVAATELQDEAVRALNMAEATYQRSHDALSRPEIDTLRAELDFQKGHIESATTMAATARRTVRSQRSLAPHDPRYSDMSTACIIECKCHLIAAGHARRDNEHQRRRNALAAARIAAEQSTKFAAKLGHSRRIARAAIWRGRVKVANPAADIGEARADLTIAQKTLPSHDRGYIYAEMESLRRAVEFREERSGIDADEVLFTVTVRDIEEIGWPNTEAKIIENAVLYFYGKKELNPGDRGLGRGRLAGKLGVTASHVKTILEKYTKL